MQRREFAKLAGAGIALPALSPGAPASKSIKAAVITGAGGVHLSSYFESLRLAEVVAAVAVCDPSGQSLPLARKLLAGKLTAGYQDRQAMLRQEKPELALVSLDGVESPPAIDAALEAGCHVLAEKPACVRLEEFERLNRKAQSRHRQLLLALANRVDPVILEARRLVREGKIGTVYGVEAHIIADQTRLKDPGYRNVWRALKARAGGGHLIWLGIHWLDLAMYVTGLPVRAVTGFTANVGGQPLDVEDSAVVAMRFENGSLGTLTSGYYLDKGYHSHLKIWGSQGWLQVHKYTNVPLEWYSTADPNPQVYRWDSTRKPPGDVYSPFVRAVARACAGLEPFPLNGDESARVLKAIFACYRAAETGQTQSI
ncbi:MAG TPA: Gfo/Idh/MocA family oxidoreductase [Bryobacteraceae bacterium]|nr:Gfo/Idh/MocA family oxidoreductase [Bryobacteraceae bacterium]